MDSWYEEMSKKSDAQLCEGSPHIEPEWTRSHVIAEQITERFEAEHFKPLLKKIEDYVSEHLWDMVRDSLLGDTTHNIAGHICHRVECTVKALLGGNKWAVDKYVMDQYDGGKSIRKALASVIPTEIMDARIADLEKDNEKLRDDLKREREWNSRR
jgi:hypothetical protein